MIVERLRRAVEEAKRFLDRANMCLDCLPPDRYDIWASKESGACRRASMDLTRALADLRRSR